MCLLSKMQCNVSVYKQNGVAPLVADPPNANWTTDTDKHLFSDIGDNMSTSSVLFYSPKHHHSKTVRADIMREGLPPHTSHMCHMSHVTYYILHVLCHMSCVACHMSIFIFFYKVPE